MDKQTHTLLTGPFTQVFKEYSNRERRHIHNLLCRYYELYYKKFRSSRENNEMKALVWVVELLQDVESA